MKVVVEFVERVQVRVHADGQSQYQYVIGVSCVRVSYCRFGVLPQEARQTNGQRLFAIGDQGQCQDWRAR